MKMTYAIPCDDSCLANPKSYIFFFLGLRLCCCFSQQNGIVDRGKKKKRHLQENSKSLLQVNLIIQHWRSLF